jgi:hypothetical protein
MVLPASHFGLGFLNASGPIIIGGGLSTVALYIGQRLLESSDAINVVGRLGLLKLPTDPGASLRTIFSRISKRTFRD